MNDLVNKLTSRKFGIAVAAFLASLGTGIVGISGGNDTLVTVGGICTVASAAIYAASEAAVDAARIKANTTATNTNINATSTSAAVVEKALNTSTTCEQK